MWGLALSPCTWNRKATGWLSEEERSRIKRKKRPDARRAAICARWLATLARAHNDCAAGGAVGGGQYG